MRVWACVRVCPSGESSIRDTTALAVEQERTKSVWKSSPSVKSVGLTSSHLMKARFWYAFKGGGVEMKAKLQLV